jgi:glutaredoxin
MTSKIVVYGRDGCEPCSLLKALLREAEVVFAEVDITKLPEPEKEEVRRQIISVSTLDTATVPAAMVTTSVGVLWISNHGSCEVADMFAEIKAALAS